MCNNAGIGNEKHWRKMVEINLVGCSNEMTSHGMGGAACQSHGMGGGGGGGDGKGADGCGKLKELKSLATSSVQHMVLDIEFL